MNHAHQTKLFDPKRARPVVLFGAGSVGSYVAFFLAKMGVTEIEVWDGDIVASHNLPMSLYRTQDVGLFKVDCLQELVRLGTGVELAVRREMYDGTKPFRKNASVISCVDTMEKGRKKIWERVKRNPSVDVFVDTRMAKAYAEVLTISPSDRVDINRYEAFLFDDKDGVRQYCGEHGVIFASTYAATVVCANLAQHWSGKKPGWRIAQQCDTLLRAQ